MLSPWILIPKNRVFWTFHVSGLSLVLLVYLISVNISRNHLWLDVMIPTIWVPTFTCAVLVLRSRILSSFNRAHSIEQEIASVLMMSIGLSLGLTLVLITLVYPFSWDVLYNAERLARKRMSLFQSVGKHISINILFNFLMVTTWGFIYLGFKSRRSVKEAENHNLKLQNSLKSAQLQNLSNQLKPHFLFNSLNNIRFMIHEDAERADHMITVLSDILRYSLEKQRDKVSLNEELTIVKQFIELAKIQFEDRLNVDWKQDETLNSCLVPPMVVQLLVENAVKHGVDNIQDQSVLGVVIESKGDTLKVTISNPVTMTNPKTVSTKTGLENIRQRIKLLYEKNASLQTTQHNGIYTAVLCLPKESAA